MEDFKSNARQMLRLGEIWKETRRALVIRPLVSAAETLEDDMKVWNWGKTGSAAVGAASNALLLGVVGAAMLVPGSPLLASLAGGLLMTATVSGINTTVDSIAALLWEQAVQYRIGQPLRISPNEKSRKRAVRFLKAVNGMDLLKKTDEEVLLSFVDSLRDSGFSFRAPAVQASCTYEASSLLAFVSRCGIVAVPKLTTAGIAGLKISAVVAKRVVLGSTGLSLVVDGISCWHGASKLANGNNSEAAKTFLEFADTLEKDSDDLITTLNHTLMEQYMDEQLKEIV